MEEEQIVSNVLNKEIILTHTITASKLLKQGKIGVNAFLLYNFYCWIASWQSTNQIRATDSFCMKGLHLGKVSFRNAKNLLLKEEIVEQIIRRREDGPISGYYVIIHYLNKNISGTLDNYISLITSNQETRNTIDKKNRNPIDKKENIYVPNSKKEKKKDSKNSLKYSLGFEEFWKEYPPRGSKIEAFKEWNKLKPNTQLKNIIIEAVKKTKKHETWKDPKYIPHCCRYLKNRRWEDILFERKTIGSNKYTEGEVLKV